MKDNIILGEKVSGENLEQLPDEILPSHSVVNDGRDLEMLAVNHVLWLEFKLLCFSEIYGLLCALKAVLV
jgi:hypothetical protein